MLDSTSLSLLRAHTHNTYIDDNGRESNIEGHLRLKAVFVVVVEVHEGCCDTFPLWDLVCLASIAVT